MSTAQDEYDALFKDNDRPSKHPEDLADRSSDDEPEPQREQYYEKDDDGNEEDDIDEETAEMRSRYFLPSLQYNANTGPKGVIADAQAYEEAKKHSRMSIFRSKDKSPALHSSYRAKDVYSSEEKSSDDDEEGGFLSRWRQSRLRELQQSDKPPRSRTASPGKRVYGNLPTVDGAGYLDAIEKVSSDTVVIVFIYDDMSEISEMVEECVLNLARKHVTTRFVKLHYLEAEMDNAGVPAILAYRGGEKFAGMVPVIDEIPLDQELDDTSLELAMRRNHIPLSL